jgi:hypothetical protein
MDGASAFRTDLNVGSGLPSRPALATLANVDGHQQGGERQDLYQCDGFPQYELVSVRVPAQS